VELLYDDDGSHVFELQFYLPTNKIYLVPKGKNLIEEIKG